MMLHIGFHGLAEVSGDDECPYVVGFHDDPPEVGRIDGGGQVAHPPVEVTSGQRGIAKSCVVHWISYPLVRMFGGRLLGLPFV